jgi:hypothetical protein
MLGMLVPLLDEEASILLRPGRDYADLDPARTTLRTVHGSTRAQVGITPKSA